MDWNLEGVDWFFCLRASLNSIWPELDFDRPLVSAEKDHLVEFTYIEGRVYLGRGVNAHMRGQCLCPHPNHTVIISSYN